MEEAYWIAREALVNALTHSGAAKMSAEILYLSGTFRLLFRDNGRGIGAAVLHSGGRPAHFGLVGMQERAQKIGGHLQIRSEAGIGTEIELNVPASIAYRGKLRPSGWHWLHRFASGGMD
jgi:signal transduction histidine kinase